MANTAYTSLGLTIELDDTHNSGAFNALIQYPAFKGLNTGYILPGLQEIGEVVISGKTSSGFDQIEVTTLSDVRHVYVDGLIANDSNSDNALSLKFLYDPDLFKCFKLAMDQEGNELDPLFGVPGKYHIHIPEGGKFTIDGTISSLNMGSVSTNSALTFTVNLAVSNIALDYTSTTAE